MGLLIAGCQTTGGPNLGGSMSQAERLAMQGRHGEAAVEYMTESSQVDGDMRTEFTLLAVEQWLLAGNDQRAIAAMDALALPVSDNLYPLYATNLAGLKLLEDDAAAAAALLEPLSRRPLRIEDRLRVDAARANTWLKMEQPSRAVEILTQREALLDSRQAIVRNRELLWRGLKRTRPVVLREESAVTSDPEVQAWLLLASLARTTGQQGIGWSNGLQRFRETHPNHPAMLILDEDQDADQRLSEYPGQIALLLPLTGRAADAGKAIQNGFIGGYLSTAGALDDRQTIRVYDVVAEGGAAKAYSKAVAEGAEFVVGPLLKGSISELANETLLPIPVLALNYLDDATPPPVGMFQFALAPEDEARTAADRAIAEGYTRAVALVPSSTWGRRVLRSFVEQFELQGGTILDFRNYTAGVADHSGTIEDLMALSGSVRRYNRMRANLGIPLQFDPRRREDVELIFLAADAPSGRLIKSQLKFHYSGDLPVYATSSIHAIDARSNADLEGVQFAETPWVSRPDSWSSYLPDVFTETWPEQRPLSRLHAMGFDAYQLVAPLYGSGRSQVVAFDGATGRLRLESDGKIRRHLSWAEFRAGRVNALPELADASGTPVEISEEQATWQDQNREL